VYELFGVPHDAAIAIGRQLDRTMADCILALYRSAIDVGKEWQPELEKVDLPSMVIWGREDPYVPLKYGERLAERMHGELVVLECGHWWPFERPRETAEALERLWAGARSAAV
jgi:pimeloyl-ACP methyl ester carboxylesterase